MRLFRSQSLLLSNPLLNLEVAKWVRSLGSSRWLSLIKGVVNVQFHLPVGVEGELPVAVKEIINLSATTDLIPYWRKTTLGRILGVKDRRILRAAAFPHQIAPYEQP